MVVLNEISPEDTSRYVTEKLGILFENLGSNKISKQDALAEIAELQQDVKLRRSFFDGSLQDQAGYLAVELLMKMAIKDINSRA
jgi:hypothetical protein